MNEKQILFSGEMVRAILDGRKTQTRRVIKPQTEHGITMCHWSDSGWAIADAPNEFGNQACTCKRVSAPYGNAGDLLWVRETWQYAESSGYDSPSDNRQETWQADWPSPIWYRATDAGEVDCKWRPSIFMPRWASRLTLRVTAVRVERVQEISEADAKAEGVTAWCDTKDGKVYQPEFRMLWDSINAKRGYSWDSNPWVWVVEFERVTE